jgi:hypothetical protein
MQKAILIIQRATTIAALVIFGAALIIGMKGPGGIELHGEPFDHSGPATLDRIEFPNCVAPEEFDGIPATSVIVNDWGVAREIPFAQAWNRNTDDTTINNVRVLGSCT